VIDGVTSSFNPVSSFGGVFLDIIPDVQVHEGGDMKPFINEVGLFGSGISNTVVNEIHAEGVVLAPSGIFVGVNPSHDEGSLSILHDSGSFLGNFETEGVASAPLSSNHEFMTDFLDISFNGVPEVQVHEERFGGVFWVEPVADGSTLSFGGTIKGLVDGIHAGFVTGAPLSPLTFFQPLFNNKDINMMVDVDTI